MAKAPEKGPSKGMKPWIIPAVLLVSAVVGGVALPFFLPSNLLPERSNPKSGLGGGKDNFSILEFDKVQVNLNTPQQNRYIVVKISLKVDAKLQKPIEELVQKHKAELKHNVLAYFKGCTLDDVNGKEGMNKSRIAIKNEFNEKLFPPENPKIQDVVFDEFHVQ